LEEISRPTNTTSATLFLSKRVNFNLKIYARNPLRYDKQIDPDSNLLNENSYNAQYADPTTLKLKMVKHKEMFSVYRPTY